MIEIINFQPFLALALFMPLLTEKRELQYNIPVFALALYYIASVGLDVAQLGYFASVIFATFVGKRMNLFKAYFVSMFGYHILANLSHGNLHHDTHNEAQCYDRNLYAEELLGKNQPSAQSHEASHDIGMPSAEG